MSALCHKQTSADRTHAVQQRTIYSITSSATASTSGGIVRKVLGSFEIEDQFVLGWCLHRKVSWFLTVEDAVDVSSRAAVLVEQIRPIGDQTAGCSVISKWIDRRQSILGRKRDDQIAMHSSQGARCYDDATIRCVREHL